MQTSRYSIMHKIAVVNVYILPDMNKISGIQKTEDGKYE